MPRPLEFTLSLPLSHSLNITLAMHSELERQFKDTTARKYDCCQEKKHPQGPKHVQHNHRLSRFPCPPSSCLDLQRPMPPGSLLAARRRRVTGLGQRRRFRKVGRVCALRPLRQPLLKKEWGVSF